MVASAVRWHLALLLSTAPCDWLIPLRPHVVGDALADLVTVVKPSLAHTPGLPARQPVTTAGVGVEPLALPQTGLRTLSALAQAGVGVEGLIPGTHCITHTAAQLLIPPLAGRAPLPLSLTFTLTFTGVMVQFPAWIAAVLSESVSTDTFTGGLF